MFFSHAGQEMWKCTHGRKHYTYPGPPAPLLSSFGLGQGLLATEGVLGSNTGSGL